MQIHLEFGCTPSSGVECLGGNGGSAWRSWEGGLWGLGNYQGQKAVQTGTSTHLGFRLCLIKMLG